MSWIDIAALTVIIISLQVLVIGADEFRLAYPSVSSYEVCGYLQVDTGSGWCTVCNYGLSEEILSVLCRQMGYGSFLQWSTEKRKKTRAEVFIEISAHCSGIEQLITDCRGYDLTRASVNSLCVARSIRKMICKATDEESQPDDSGYRNFFVAGNHDLLYNLAESFNDETKSETKYDVNVINLNENAAEKLRIINKDELNYKQQFISNHDEIKPLQEKQDEVGEIEPPEMDTSATITNRNEAINVRKTRSMEGWTTNSDMETDVTTLSWNDYDVTTYPDQQSTKLQLINKDKYWSVEDDIESTTVADMDATHGRNATTTIKSVSEEHNVATDLYDSASAQYIDSSTITRDLSKVRLDLTTELTSISDARSTKVSNVVHEGTPVDISAILSTLRPTQSLGTRDSNENTTEDEPVTRDSMHMLTPAHLPPSMAIKNKTASPQTSSIPNMNQTFKTFSSQSPLSLQPKISSKSSSATPSVQKKNPYFTTKTPSSASAKTSPLQRSTTSKITLDEEILIEVPKWGLGVQRITGVNQAPTAARQVLRTPTTPTPYPEFKDKPFVLETLAPAKDKIAEQEYELGNQGDLGNDLNGDGQTKEYTWVQSCSHFWHTVNGTNQRGVISSPRYPQPYPAAESCKWVLISDLSQTVTIEIIDLNLRQGIDMLSLIAKVDGAFSHVYNLTGDLAGVPNATFVLNSTLIYLEFTTSNYVNKHHRGFKVSYTLNSPEIIITDKGNEAYHRYLSFRVILILAAMCFLLLVAIVAVFIFWKKDLNRRRSLCQTCCSKIYHSTCGQSIKILSVWVTPFKPVSAPSMVDMKMHNPQAFPENIIEVNNLREKPPLPSSSVAYDDTTFVFMKRQRVKQPKPVVQPVLSYNSPQIMTPRSARKNHGLLGMLRSGSKIFPNDKNAEVRKAITHTPIEVLDGQTPFLDRIEDGFGTFLSNETYTVNKKKEIREAPFIKDDTTKSVTLQEIRQEKNTQLDNVLHRNIKPENISRTLKEKQNSNFKVDELNLESLDLDDESIEEVSDLRGTYTIKKEEKRVEVKQPPLKKTVSPALPRKGSRIPVVTPRTDRKNQQISTISSGGFRVNTNVAGKVSITNKRGDWSTPGEFMCQLSGKVMENPVRADDGFTYEKSVIVNWLQAQSVSPMTNRKITRQGLKLDSILRGRIQRWRLTQRGDIIQRQSQLKKASENILCDIED
ncbi:hypothetical protein CAPTEDRAFT_186518 [Capitella teleta]|uniref:CUB domain-containing protein n=1 Tax=Capitella teleta TaxID=283909 RepID=R7V2R0_CAPTE|nr:hypothetical protein CAPTEDRAFT_186518 [Capitella teleta]|eukprot:ELU12834.1 hypothetical protein CAPTEDRAFT_186518 [Capitella teleta]